MINTSYLHACVCPTRCGWGKLHKLAASVLMPSECTPAQFPQKRDVASLRSPHSLSATELLSLLLCITTVRQLACMHFLRNEAASMTASCASINPMQSS